MLSVGIVGLPNVGKSTLFNALASTQANVSNYPFTTIDSNVGVVPVPDARLEQLNQILKPQECTPCFIEFIDIAGLVRGASQGEGLGNQFLGNIRQVDAVAHVIRCFEDPNVAHVLEKVDPARDIEIIETELLLADLGVLNAAIEKQQRIWKTNPREYAAEQEQWSDYKEKLEAGIPLRNLPLSPQDQRQLKGLGLLTAKPVIYVANLSDEQCPRADRILESLKGAWPDGPRSPERVAIAAQYEGELQQLEPEEQEEFLKDLGVGESGLQRLVKFAFKALGLITFYTIANEKLRAWEIVQGAMAPEAAGKVHTDMERGFIRAQIVSFEQLLEHKSFQELHQLGLVRTEGKDYVVEDGDVVQFLFSS